MKSIIKEICFGRRGQIQLVKENEKYWETLNKIVELSDEITKTLSESQKQLFTEFCNLHSVLLAEGELEHYAEGFKTGLLIGIESAGE